MTHSEKYGAFLQNERFDLHKEVGLRQHLRRCCFAVAAALGTQRAIYLADTDGPAGDVARCLKAGIAFDGIVNDLLVRFGPPSGTFSQGTNRDYFIDDFSRVDSKSRLYLGPAV